VTDADKQRELFHRIIKQRTVFQVWYFCSLTPLEATWVTEVNWSEVLGDGVTFQVRGTARWLTDDLYLVSFVPRGGL